jgi:hypothetical protein
LTSFETDSLMKMRVENSLNQSSGKKDDVVPIAVMIDPVSFEEQVHGPDCTNVIIAGDNLQ